MDGFVTTQLLYVAVRLDLAGALADGPATGAELAERVGADAAALTRVLRSLALEDVVSEQDGRFALTPLGGALPAMAGPLTVRGELYYHGAEGLLDAVRDGGTAFERVYGAPFFRHLDAHPDHEAAFEASMAGRAEQEAAAVVAAYDFTRFASLVDAARVHLGDRATCVEGDFFDRLPAGADAYLLSRVLHDWDDDAARRILGVCAAAMRPDSRLLVVDAILPERATDQPFAVRMDLHMLLLLNARERTEAEFRDLLASAGFALRATTPTGSPAGLGVIEAVRRSA